MCDICHSTPCLSGCPNEPEPPTVEICHVCGEDIMVGDKYINENVSICEYCIDGMSASDLLVQMNIHFITAEQEEPDYD